MVRAISNPNLTYTMPIQRKSLVIWSLGLDSVLHNFCLPYPYNYPHNTYNIYTLTSLLLQTMAFHTAIISMLIGRPQDVTCQVGLLPSGCLFASVCSQPFLNPILQEI